MIAPAQFADDLIFDIQRRITGRIACERNNCNYLAWSIAQAGDGDHLEIGTLFGGTAILAALLKQRLGLAGEVYCIDPLDGYYLHTPYACAIDPVSGWPVSLEIVQANALEFGVDDRIHFIRSRSQPWPVEMIGKTFASAYIDGDHWQDTPTRDWQCVQQQTHGHVVFDNHDDQHPSVLAAGRQAKNTVGWQTVLETRITLVLRRVHESG